MGGGIVHVWGNTGTGSSVLDCVFRGNAAIPYGIVALNPQGLKVERSVPVHGVIEPFDQMVKNIKSKPS